MTMSEVGIIVAGDKTAGWVVVDGKVVVVAIIACGRGAKPWALGHRFRTSSVSVRTAHIIYLRTW